MEWRQRSPTPRRPQRGTGPRRISRPPLPPPLGTPSRASMPRGRGAPPWASARSAWGLPPRPRPMQGNPTCCPRPPRSPAKPRTLPATGRLRGRKPLPAWRPPARSPWRNRPCRRARRRCRRLVPQHPAAARRLPTAWPPLRRPWAGSAIRRRANCRFARPSTPPCPRRSRRLPRRSRIAWPLRLRASLRAMGRRLRPPMRALSPRTGRLPKMRLPRRTGRFWARTGWSTASSRPSSAPTGCWAR